MSDTREKRSMPARRRIELGALSVMGIGATLLMFANSIGRYVLGTTIVWAEEIIRILFVWSMFIAITTAFFRNEHIGFDNLAKKPGFFNVLYRAVSSICLLVVGACLVWFGTRYTIMTGRVPLPATNLPTALFMWPGVVAGLAWACLGAWRLVALLLGRPEGGRK